MKAKKWLMLLTLLAVIVMAVSFYQAHRSFEAAYISNWPHPTLVDMFRLCANGGSVCAGADVPWDSVVLFSISTALVIDIIFILRSLLHRPKRTNLRQLLVAASVILIFVAGFNLSKIYYDLFPPASANASLELCGGLTGKADAQECGQPAGVSRVDMITLTVATVAFVNMVIVDIGYTKFNRDKSHKQKK